MNTSRSHGGDDRKCKTKLNALIGYIMENLSELSVLALGIVGSLILALCGLVTSDLRFYVVSVVSLLGTTPILTIWYLVTNTELD